jgi:hypothetical protein
VDLREFEEFLGVDVLVQPLAEKQHPDDPEMGYDWFPEGEPFRGHWRKLSEREAYEEGKSNVTVAYRFYHEGDVGPLPVDTGVKMRLRFVPREDMDAVDLDITNVSFYRHEGITIIDAERTY